MKPYDPFPRPGTPEWDDVNVRRAQLIIQDIEGPPLTAEEKEELDYLQTETLRAIDEVYPRPKMDPADKAYLEAMEREMEDF